MGSKYLWMVLALLSASPAWSGDIIAFTNGGGSPNIFKMNPDGTNVAQLTTSNAAAGPLQWSKDGSQITYADGGGRIHIMNANGSNDHTLSNASATHDGFPSWYPNGTQLVFMDNINGLFPPKTEIHSVNVDGTNETAQLANGNFFNADPQISPDGSTIVLESSYPAGGSNPFSLFTCTVASCSTTFGLLTALASPPNQYADPNWSFDAVPNSASGWVVMSYSDGSGNLNVAKIRPNGTGFVVLTSYTCPSEAGDASFNPTNSKITFEFDSNTGGLQTCNGQNNNAIPTLVYTANANGSSAGSTGQGCSNIGCAPRYQPVTFSQKGGFAQW